MNKRVDVFPLNPMSDLVGLEALVQAQDETTLSKEIMAQVILLIQADRALAKSMEESEKKRLDKLAKSKQSLGLM